MLGSMLTQATVEPAYGTVPLLLIALGAVAVLLTLIIAVRLHAFVALVLVSLLTALVAGITPADVVGTLTDGFGSTLASVALLVGLGAMLGRLLEVSGGAQALADTLISRFGEHRAPLALGITSLVMGFPIFFDAGLVVLLPIVFTVARRLGGSVLIYALPTAGAFAVMHAFVPPHPGPVAAAQLIGADVGLVLVMGLVVGIPTWFLGSYLFGVWIGRQVYLPTPLSLGVMADAAAGAASSGAESSGSRDGDDGGSRRQRRSGSSTAVTGGGDPDDADESGPSEPEFANPVSVPQVVFILLIPLVLIFANTGLGALAASGTVDGDATWVAVVQMIGQTPIALLITVLVAMYVCGWRRRESPGAVETIVNDALAPVCAIILITGAGGMFGGVLRASGIGEALASTLEGTGLPVIVAAFVIALAIRVAQGSATVALTTAGGLMAPVVEASSGLSPVYLALTVIAIAAGSTALSHVNDSGFWLVGRFLGMDVRTTLKTWTVMETLLGFIGFGIAFVLSLVL